MTAACSSERNPLVNNISIVKRTKVHKKINADKMLS